MPETMDTRLSRLRERAERALASGRRGGDVLTVLISPSFSCRVHPGAPRFICVASCKRARPMTARTH
jgi:hypothetical protein